MKRINVNNFIIQAAREAHKNHWVETSDESTGDKQASTVTRVWQKAILSDTIQAEVLVADHLNEKIDVVDFSTATAYEMKVSGKNPHHEFYKDIFKVFVYNQHKTPALKKLVFITEKDGAMKLKRGLAKETIDGISQVNLIIDVIGI